MNAHPLSLRRRVREFVIVGLVIAMGAAFLAPAGVPPLHGPSPGGSSASSSPGANTVTFTSGDGDAPWSVGTISPASPAIDDGQSITLSAGVSGGAPPYTIAWYLSPDGSGACPGDGVQVETNSSNHVTGALSSVGGPYYYCYIATDTGSNSSVSTWDQVTVNSQLSSGSPNPSSPTIDFGQTILLSSDVSDGTPSYTYQWSWSGSNAGSCSSGAGLGTGSTQSTGSEITGAGTYYYCYGVTDSSQADSGPASAAATWDPVTVHTELTSPGVPTPSATALDPEQVLTVTGTIPSTGTSTYSWHWLISTNGGSYGAASQCALASGSGATSGQTETCSISAGALTAGDSYAFELKVSDSASTPESATSSPSSTVLVSSALSSGSATPASPSIDSGQSISLAAHPSGGTTPYHYQWYSSSTDTGACNGGGALGTSVTQSASPTVGKYYCYTVADSAHSPVIQSSAWDLVTVNSALTAPVAPTVSATLLDVNQGFTVTGVIPSTGTPTYSWHWLASVSGAAYADATQCSVNSGSGAIGGTTESCSISASTLTVGATYTFELKVSDSASATETKTSTASSAATVRSSLTAPGAPIPSVTALDADQNLTVTATLASTGTPTYSWQWLVSAGGGGYSDATQCGASANGTGGAGAAKVVCAIPGDTLTASSSYTFELKVTDNASTPEAKTSAASSAVTTSSALTAGTPSPTSPVIESGQSVELSARPSGGSGSYTYQWYSGSTAGACTALSAPISGTSSATYSASPTATTYFCYVVKDSHSNAATSTADQVTVNSALAAPAAPTVSATALDSDQMFAVTGTIPSTGTPTYSWQWLVSTDSGAFIPATRCGANGGSGAVAAVAETCAIGASMLTGGDTYAFELNVTDSATTPGRATSPTSSTVSVRPALTTPGPPTPSATSLAADQGLTVTGTIPSSGTPAYSWQWLISTAGGAYADATECGASASGTGASGGATETCSIPGGSLAAGESYAFELEVTDHASTPETQESEASSTVTMSSALSAGDPTPSSPILDAGQSVTLTAEPSGGSGSYSYQWYSGSTASECTGLGSPIAGMTSSTYVASPTTTTYYCYVVADSPHPGAGPASAASQGVLVTVNPALAAPAPPTGSSTTLNVGETLTVTGTIPSSGTPTYSWEWLTSIDGGAFENATQCGVNRGAGAVGGATETCSIEARTLTAGDAYAFELRVTDNASSPVIQTSAPTSTVEVTSGVATTSPAGFSWYWVYEGIVLTAIGALVLVAVLSLRRRRSHAQVPDPPLVAEEGPTSPPATNPIEPPPAYLEGPAAPTYVSRPEPPAAVVGSPVPTAASLTPSPEDWSDVESVMAELDEISTEMSKRGPKKTGGTEPEDDTGGDRAH